MKRLMMYIAVFILITACMLMFFIRNFPAEMTELNLDGVVNPNQIDIAMKDNSIFDYLNIYEIFVRSESANIYTGNINILLRKSDIKAGALTYKDDEIIMGEKHMEENFRYSLLGEKYQSQFGEYNVNCIIKNIDKTYYRDINILQNVNIKNQRLYISLFNEKRAALKYKQTIDAFMYNNISVAKSIYYLDVINFFKKLLIILIIAEFAIIFLELLAYTKNNIVALSKSRQSSQYDYTINEFILESNNVKAMLKILSQVVMLVLLGVSMMWATVVILKITTSYVIDYSSLKSIINAITDFTSLMKYYIANGLSNISSALISCIIIYLMTFFAIFIINVIKFYIKLKEKGKFSFISGK
jgi:hypothetical protein